MKVKNLLFMAMAVITMVAVAVPTFAVLEHVRYNPLLDECVYYYNAPKGSAHCFVHPNNCDDKRGNIFKEINPVECSREGFNKQEEATPEPTNCAEFTEGDLIVLNYDATDPDKDVGPAGKLVYTVGKPFNEEKEWQTARGDAGNYVVEVVVSDGEYDDKDVVCFNILEGNEKPVLTVDDVEVNEGELVKLEPKCTDEDGDKVKITYSGHMKSDTWMPNYNDDGVYTVVVKCSDGTDSDTESVKITVNDYNRKPSLRVSDVTVTEGQNVVLSPSCSDPDGGKVVVAFSGDMLSGEWMTDYDDAGDYSVGVSCVDEEGDEVHDTINVRVKDKNRAPMITAMVTRG
ncbi:MAG: hypothetical protein OXR66_08545 [Candidatus Woesearchaeota archaeon]|nr:hypothetical protein [Candidatus Woesearchaeota archaeon]